MDAMYFLFLEKEPEITISAYLSEYLQTGEPVILKDPFSAKGDLKYTKEPVIVITQKTLAKDLADIGSLHESINELRKAGIIVLPDESFVSIHKTTETTEKTQISITTYRVAEQFKRSVALIIDESMPKNSVLWI